MSIMDKLSQFQSSAPVDVEAAIKSVGISLKKAIDLAPGVAGHIRPLDGGRFEIATTKHDHPYRQRFTMAHELGHFVLHRSLIGSGVGDDIKYRSTETEDFYNTDIDLVHEKQANSFAANFLMPKDLVEKIFENDMQSRSLRWMAGTFRVSPSAMRWRMSNLRLKGWHDEWNMPSPGDRKPAEIGGKARA